MNVADGQTLSFGPYQLNLAEERLWRGSEAIKLTPKSFSLLHYLAERRGRLITKEELFEAVWPNIVVSDAALTRCIREIREALADDARSPSYIETAHRRGFRFIGPTREMRKSIPRTTTKYAKNGGVNIAYQVVGDGPIDLVMVPGWTTNVEGWWEFRATTEFYERLAAFSRLILFDKRGTGMSDPFPLDRPPTLEQRMDDVKAVMDAVGMEKAVLFGYSEGGPMSLLFAATYPERTIALVLYGTFAKQEWDDTFGGHLAATPDELNKMIEDRWADGWPPLAVWAPSFAVSEEARREFARYMRLAASPAAAAAIMKISWDIDVRPILPAIHVPTLILHRREEEAIGVKHGRYLAAHIPNAKYIEMPGIDHLLWAGDPEDIADAVEQFIASSARSHKPSTVVTVLLLEIVPPFGLADGPVRHTWRDLPEQLRLRVRKELSRFRGRAATETLCATFDGPIRAIRCALRFLVICRELGLQVRASVHTGESEYHNGMIEGEAVAVAEQVLSRVMPGEVWISSATKSLIPGSGIEFTDLGLHVCSEQQREYSVFKVKVDRNTAFKPPRLVEDSHAPVYRAAGKERSPKRDRC